ncbi:hypothetical protein LXT12_15595 [Pelomonas sp. P7]|uniref:Uncharacterized protein n=1 Tax=Pelomonas caseinilytica TaxID=2906763 RepID=A0ABS8XHF1_9BURK|nr:hypothetical protein [Pelomonas sp. P7]MCE4538675.1 hypothetical protein [Pelomonas sp. P7]
MNAAAWNQMLLAPWRQRDRMAPWGRRLLAALMLLSIAAALYVAPGLWPQVVAASLALAAATLWMVLIGSLLVQNHPHAARFVPGHARQLRQAALAAWALLSATAAVLPWLLLPGTPSLPALLLLSAAVLAFAAWAVRQWMLWFLLSFGPALFFGAGLDRRLAPLWQALRALWEAQTLPVLALGLFGLGWAVARLFGDGDAAHLQAYACRARLQRAARGGMNGKRDDAGAFGRPGEWLARPFDRAAAAWLRHTLATARPDEASVMQRAEIVLHGQQHWLRQALGTLFALGLAALGFLFAFTMAGKDLQGHWQQGAYGMAIGLASMGFNPGFSLPNMLWHSRREQALLRLLPGMPLGARQNHALAWMQLRQCLVAWTLTTAALAGLAHATGDTSLLCLALGTLPLSPGALLRPPARMKAPSAWTVALPIFGFLVLGWGLYALQKHWSVPLPLLAAASVAATLAVGAWCWRRALRAPDALPAGRCA